MTYTILELHRVVCDGCAEEKEMTIHPDEDTEDCIRDFDEKLKEDGWVYDKESDEHYCPDCAKEMKEDDEL